MEKIYRIHGIPVAQGRPRFARKGNNVHVYDPKECKDWKKYIAWSVVQQGKAWFDGALEVDLIFYLPRPKMFNKMTAYPVKKPDIDNLAKAVFDALNGVCFKADSQIVKATIRKEFREENQAGVRIAIEEL